jgi:hypothetical protein
MFRPTPFFALHIRENYGTVGLTQADPDQIGRADLSQMDRERAPNGKLT